MKKHVRTRDGSSLAVVVVLASTLLAACNSRSSSGSRPSIGSPSAAGQAADVWVAGLCTAFDTFLSQPLPMRNEPTKKTVDAFFDDEISAADKFVSDVKALGAPAIPGGEQLSSDLIRAYTTLASALRSLRDQLASLPTSDPSALAQGTMRLFREAGPDLAKAGRSLEAIQANPQLQTAFSSVAACGQNTASGGESSVTPA